MLRWSAPRLQAQEGLPHFLAISHTVPLTSGPRPNTGSIERSNSTTRRRNSCRRRLKVCMAVPVCMLIIIITYRYLHVKEKREGLQKMAMRGLRKALLAGFIGFLSYCLNCRVKTDSVLNGLSGSSAWWRYDLNQIAILNSRIAICLENHARLRLTPPWRHTGRILHDEYQSIYRLFLIKPS